MKMEVHGGAFDEEAELIKWWDVLDELVKMSDCPDKSPELQMVRECQHPDALWLASLFPAGVAVSPAEVRETLRQQGDDPRALCISCFVGEGFSDDAREKLRLAAELGYAPAQSAMSALTRDEESLMWATMSSSQGDRSGYFQLGTCFELAQGCAVDMGKAIEMFKRAAELGHAEAQLYYGRVAFGELDWERYAWVARGMLKEKMYLLGSDLFGLLPALAEGEHGRILNTVAPALTKCLEAARLAEVARGEVTGEVRMLERALETHQLTLGRARQAVDCWSVVARRCGVVKDVRVMIAKMAWQEPWRWRSVEKFFDNGGGGA
jgi:hypothetical protein